MLEYALHPVEDRLIHVDDHCRADPSPRQWARCPLCLEALQVVQLRDRSHARRFVHLAGDFARCPLVDDALPNPLILQMGPPLNERARQLRAKFFQNWQKHLHTMRQIVVTFGVARFMRAIEHADVLKLWAWPTLTQREIPYILLVLADYIAAPRGERQAPWSRFWFDASVQRVDDLSKPRGKLPRLFRLRYKPPRKTAFPNARHLIDCQPVAMEPVDVPTGAAFDEARLRGADELGADLPGAEVAAFESFAARMLRPRPEDTGGTPQSV